MLVDNIIHRKANGLGPSDYPGDAERFGEGEFHCQGKIAEWLVWQALASVKWLTTPPVFKVYLLVA